ncbi:MAG: exopolysaccharide biosynthesis protein [Lysobacterales bacterium]
MSSKAQRPARISTLLADLLLRRAEANIAFGELVDAIQDRGFGALLILISLPCLVPLPIGISGPVFGGMLCLLSVQMMLGFEHPWLPRFMRRIEIPTAGTARFVARLDPWLLRLERLCQPNWHWFLNPIGRRITGVWLFLTGLALALPIPFTNVPIALVLAGYGMALLEHDGRWLAVLWSISLLIVVGFLIIGQHFLGAGMSWWHGV